MLSNMGSMGPKLGYSVHALQQQAHKVVISVVQRQPGYSGWLLGWPVDWLIGGCLVGWLFGWLVAPGAPATVRANNIFLGSREFGV